MLSPPTRESRGHDVTALAQRAMLACRPANAIQLHTWIRCMLGISVPRLSRIAGHAAPFEYLQHAFFEDRRSEHRNAIVWASRGSGKTMLGAIATLVDMIYKPGIEICILGGSFAQSSRMHAHLRRFLTLPAIAELVSGNITQSHVQLVNGSRVEIVSQSQTSVRGLRAHRLRCDEVELFTPEVWEAAQLITRSGRCGEIDVRAGIEALSTMHKPYGLMHTLLHSAESIRAQVFRWNVIDVLEHCPPGRACEDCDLFPAIEGGCQGAAKDDRSTAAQRTHIARNYFRIDDAIDQRTRISPPTWMSEMLCNRPNVSDSVYPEFDEALHVGHDADLPANDASITWLGGIDFGYRAPTVVLLAMLDGANVLHVVDELVERGMRSEAVIARTREMCVRRGVFADRGGVRFFGCDPAGLQRSDQSGISTVTLWRRAGFVMRTRATTIEAGIETVRRRLSDGVRPGLRIHARCVNLIRAMRKYHYADDREDDSPPLKNGPDHACDALRYMIVNLDSRSSAVTVREY